MMLSMVRPRRLVAGVERLLAARPPPVIAGAAPAPERVPVGARWEERTGRAWRCEDAL